MNFGFRGWRNQCFASWGSGLVLKTSQKGLSFWHLDCFSIICCHIFPTSVLDWCQPQSSVSSAWTPRYFPIFDTFCSQPKPKVGACGGVGMGGQSVWSSLKSHLWLKLQHLGIKCYHLLSPQSYRIDISKLCLRLLCMFFRWQNLHRKGG